MSNFLPNELIEKLKLHKGFDVEAWKEVHRTGDCAASIRLNPKKLKSVSFSGTFAVPWCDQGYYLAEFPFLEDPLYWAGGYRLQEASSMFVAHIVQTIGLRECAVRALDICAGHGIMTSLLSSYLHPDSLLISNQSDVTQSGILKDGLVRWGDPIGVMTSNDPSAFGRLPGFFDLMMVDAPSSGIGRLGRDDVESHDWVAANVVYYSEQQKRLLAQSVATLKEGGYLIYSTYSYFEQENEDILDWLISEHGFETVQIEIPTSWGIVETISDAQNAFGYRFYPHMIKGDGLFIGVLRRCTPQDTFDRPKLNKEESFLSYDALSEWVMGPDALTSFLDNDYIHVFPKMYTDDVKWMGRVLDIRQAGTIIGRWIGDELLPSNDLALSTYLSEGVDTVELSPDSALKLLLRAGIGTKENRGSTNRWCVVQYKGVNISWIKE
ncbi:MAG: methyltransferase RsmF C-terminal domain-like protein [Sphingobacterium sp.]|uniref:hypothetical protein n=1 Tax=Sphingobacterium sp. JB170 TaxID=1434842 RepID=UPI00097E7871|nr:hypothetical protein [Sphingobacterium sp. JB170]SJN41904.1 tRNA and rRNA cytosine-C5-methylases [Sphingobacterium sp. JB170]